jgi:Leucine-rich repeat (LRR) protein
MKKRVLSLMLAVSIAFSLGVPTGASEDFITGDFTTADALTVMREVAGLEELTREQKYRLGYCNPNMRPATADALRILQIAAGLIPQPDYIMIDGRQYCTTLKRVEFFREGITSEDLISLQRITNLNELSIVSGGVSDITPLADLTNLQALWLVFNEITDITPISKLINLNRLFLQYNQITDITPLAELFDLMELSIFDNQITDFSPLSQLKSLRHLWLDFNPDNKEQVEALQKVLPNCEFKLIELRI